VVGQVAAEVRAFRPPEPYKGKGIRYARMSGGPQRDQEEVRSRSHDDQERATPAPLPPDPRAHRQAVLRAPDGAPHQPAHLRQRHLRRRWQGAGQRSTPRRKFASSSARRGKGGNAAAATLIGKRIAEKAKAAGIEKVAFDRSGFAYHGRVKALAEAAREAGLQF
jgi:hypothetical protein